jgi:hypothetical protein
MRTIFALCGLILVVGVFFAWRSMQMPTHYGAFAGAPKADVAALIEHPKDYLGKTVSVEGTVRKQCKAMGCYFFMPSGTKMLRVELQEIAMNAPMREGHQARVEGQIVPYGDGYQLFASAVEFE